MQTPESFPRNYAIDLIQNLFQRTMGFSSLGKNERIKCVVSLIRLDECPVEFVCERLTHRRPTFLCGARNPTGVSGFQFFFGAFSNFDQFVETEMRRNKDSFEVIQKCVWWTRQVHRVGARALTRRQKVWADNERNIWFFPAALYLFRSNLNIFLFVRFTDCFQVPQLVNDGSTDSPTIATDVISPVGYNKNVKLIRMHN